MALLMSDRGACMYLPSVLSRAGRLLNGPVRVDRNPTITGKQSIEQSPWFRIVWDKIMRADDDGFIVDGSATFNICTLKSRSYL